MPKKALVLVGGLVAGMALAVDLRAVPAPHVTVIGSTGVRERATTSPVTSIYGDLLEKVPTGRRFDQIIATLPEMDPSTGTRASRPCLALINRTSASTVARRSRSSISRFGVRICFRVRGLRGSLRRLPRQATTDEAVAECDDSHIACTLSECCPADSLSRSAHPADRTKQSPPQR